MYTNTFNTLQYLTCFACTAKKISSSWKRSTHMILNYMFLIEMDLYFFTIIIASFHKKKY